MDQLEIGITGSGYADLMNLIAMSSSHPVLEFKRTKGERS